MSYRERLEAIIETAIELLDLLDGDTELEDDGTAEPYIAGSSSDCELDDADNEPWLGWCDREDQSKPHQGHFADLDYESGSREWGAEHAA